MTQTLAQRPTGRLYFLDNLRVVLMVVVIAHHVAQAYGPTEGWWPIQEAARAALLGPFFTVNRSFGMSFFFMIAGYFTVMACDAKGARVFIYDRLLRLGLPVVAWALFMMALQLFVFAPSEGGSRSAWPVDVGHLWFVQHLLIFSGGYALWQTIRRGRAGAAARQGTPPGYLAIVIFALVVALVSAIVRTWYPIDKWILVLGFIRVAPADVPRDLSLFVVGVMAYRRGWLQTFPTRTGIVWLLVGLVLAALRYLYELQLNRVLVINEPAYGLIYAIWESLLCFGMCIGLTILFRETLDHQGRLARAMARSQYAAYIFHVPIVMLVQYLLLGLALLPLAKFALATLIAVPVTFLFSALVRKPLRL